METQLKDRIIIITGGTGRLGSALTKLILERGGQAMVTYHDEAEQERLKGSLAGDLLSRLELHKVDVSAAQEVEKFIAAVIEKHGRIDGLANLVGGWEEKPFLDMTWEDWQRQMTLNLSTAWLMTHTVLPHMVQANYGRIVSVSSKAALEASPKVAHYNVSKVGVAWLMKSIANEFADTNITANAVVPSAIAPRDGSAKGLLVTPEEASETIAFLLSEASAATSGGMIPVYGRK